MAMSRDRVELFCAPRFDMPADPFNDPTGDKNTKPFKCKPSRKERQAKIKKFKEDWAKIRKILGYTLATWLDSKRRRGDVHPPLLWIEDSQTRAMRTILEIMADDMFEVAATGELKLYGFLGEEQNDNIPTSLRVPSEDYSFEEWLGKLNISDPEACTSAI